MKKKTSKELVKNLVAQNAFLSEQLDQQKGQNLEISSLLESSEREKLTYFYLLNSIYYGLSISDFKVLIECTIEPDNKVGIQFHKNLEFMFNRLSEMKLQISEFTNIKAEAVGTAPAEIN